MQTYQKAICALVFFVVGTAISAQAQTPAYKTPADYNDYIIMEQNVIGKKLEEYNQSLAQDEIKVARKKHTELVTLITQSVQKINAMPDYKGNTEFKNAAFELFTFYKMIVEQDYVKIMNIVEKEGINDNSFMKINNIFTAIQQDETVMLGVFNRAQQNFSKQFDMKIQENEFEKMRKEKADSLNGKP